jgi:hypothetical protein
MASCHGAWARQMVAPRHARPLRTGCAWLRRRCALLTRPARRGRRMMSGRRASFRFPEPVARRTKGRGLAVSLPARLSVHPAARPRSQRPLRLSSATTLGPAEARLRLLHLSRRRCDSYAGRLRSVPSRPSRLARTVDFRPAWRVLSVAHCGPLRRPLDRAERLERRRVTGAPRSISLIFGSASRRRPAVEPPIR